MAEVNALNLFLAYEDRLLLANVVATRAIPALVITGFLGSGKTTLVKHLLHNRGQLRVAVLVNEVGEVDLDSQYVNLKQSNAAIGVHLAMDLAGGCVCCSLQGRVKEALLLLRQNFQRLDYLLVETSGAATPEPLVTALKETGFHVSSVVVLVDAEEGLEALNLDVAQAQLDSADMVVLSKCDLASLASSAQVEDRVHELAPGVRVLRSRHGQVPVEALLDLDLASRTANNRTGAATTAATPASAAATVSAVQPHNTMGFMSHEAAPPQRVSRGRYRPESHDSRRQEQQNGSRQSPRHHQQNKLQRQAEDNTPHAQRHDDQHSNQRDEQSDQHQQQQQQQQQQQPPHQPQSLQPRNRRLYEHHNHENHLGHSQQHMPASLHSGVSTRTVQLECVSSLHAFQQWVTQRLQRCSSLYRAKGMLWFAENRRRRYSFQLSGRCRVVCQQEGEWAQPPRQQLVLIGANDNELQQLADSFVSLCCHPSAASTKHKRENEAEGRLTHNREAIMASGLEQNGTNTISEVESRLRRVVARLQAQVSSHARFQFVSFVAGSIHAQREGVCTGDEGSNAEGTSSCAQEGSSLARRTSWRAEEESSSMGRTSSHAQCESSNAQGEATLIAQTGMESASVATESPYPGGGSLHGENPRAQQSGESVHVGRESSHAGGEDERVVGEEMGGKSSHAGSENGRRMRGQAGGDSTSRQEDRLRADGEVPHAREESSHTGTAAPRSEGKSPYQEAGDRGSPYEATRRAGNTRNAHEHQLQVCTGEDGGGLFRFTVEGAPLHGVFSEEVNAAVVTAVNAGRAVMLSHEPAPPRISTATLTKMTTGVSCIQYAISSSTDPDSFWEEVCQRAGPVLRRSFAAVRHCKCDIHGTADAPV